VIIFLGQERGEIVGLPYPDFEREQSPGSQMAAGDADQLPDQFIPAFAGKNGDPGIMQDLA
jgi:hypothetical protein